MTGSKVKLLISWDAKTYTQRSDSTRKYNIGTVLSPIYAGARAVAWHEYNTSLEGIKLGEEQQTVGVLDNILVLNGGRAGLILKNITFEE